MYLRDSDFVWWWLCSVLVSTWVYTLAGLARVDEDVPHEKGVGYGGNTPRSCVARKKKLAVKVGRKGVERDVIVLHHCCMHQSVGGKR